MAGRGHLPTNHLNMPIMSYMSFQFGTKESGPNILKSFHLRRMLIDTAIRWMKKIPSMVNAATRCTRPAVFGPLNAAMTALAQPVSA